MKKKPLKPAPPAGRGRYHYFVLAVLALAGFGATYAIVKVAMSQSPTAPPGMVWIPGGEFTMGSNDPTSRRPSAPPTASAWTVSGWTRPTSPTRSSAASSRPPATSPPPKRPRPWKKSCGMRCRDSPPRKEDLVPASMVFTPPSDPSRCDPRRYKQWWKLDSRRRLAPPRRPGQFHRRQGRPPRRPRFLVRRDRLRQVGGQAACRPRPSGNSLRGAAWTARNTSGATSRSPTSIRSATTFRATFPTTTRRTTATLAPRRSRRFRPTATACTTWPATSGSGATTGIFPTPTH